jgi:Tetratricopeptide repeat
LTRDSNAHTESGTARLDEAVAAYRAALEERTRERVPLQWAMTQNNLGNALSSPAHMEEALACVRGAVEIYQQGGENYWIPIVKSRVSETEAELVKLKR